MYETEDLNLHVFNMITGVNESRTIIKHISSKCEYKFNGKKCSSNQKWNNNKWQCECKNPKGHRVCKKKNNDNNIWNPATCSCKNGKYTRNIIHDSVITCDKIVEETKTIPTKSTSAKCTSI